jgi:hypothetical protein
MNTHAAALLAWGVCGLVLVLIACAVVLALANHYDLWLVDFFIAVASAGLVGALVTSRQPRNPVGWLILGHAFCFSLGEFSRQYAIYGLQTNPGSLPFARAMIWPTYWIWYPGLILMLSLLPLYFPNGRLVSSGWRWISRLIIVFGVGATGVAMVRPGDNEARGIPNPLGIESLSEGTRASSVFGTFWSALGPVLAVGWILLGAVAVASLIVRFRRSRGEERQQLKWFVYAVVLFLSVSMASKLFSTEVLSSAVGEFLFVVTLESLWVAIGVAVLRYRLYDIDLVINRTLVYGTLTGTLVALYFGGIVVSQRIFIAVMGERSSLAVVASTLVIAALFQPLRARIQSLIDRRFYRSKYDARKTLEGFSAKLRDETDLRVLNDELVEVVRKTMQPSHVSLWWRLDTPQQREQAH